MILSLFREEQTGRSRMRENILQLLDFAPDEKAADWEVCLRQSFIHSARSDIPHETFVGILPQNLTKS